MSSPQITIIADDLTGAADTGASFALAGLTTLVGVTPGKYPPADVLVISTHSRHLTEDEASARSRRAAESILETWPGGGPAWVYKKIDSTLRGHPGAELAVVMEVLGADRALVASAFPDQGRTTVDGHQLVNGCPLETTPFGHEVHTSSLATLFQPCARGRQSRLVGLDTVRSGVRAIVEVLEAPGPALFVADAETDADLASLAEAAAVAGVRLLCGSAGLARALGRFLHLEPMAPAPEVPAPVRGPILVVAGSRHSRTARQIEVAQQRGVVVIRPEAPLLGVSGDVAADPAEVGFHLSQGCDVIVTTVGLGESPHGSQGVAERLAEVAKVLVESHLVGGLVLTGGDIANAVCTVLGSTTLWLRGEVEPGIPLGRLLDGACASLSVVTKAGGFGTDEALVRAIRQLRAGF